MKTRPQKAFLTTDIDEVRAVELTKPKPYVRAGGNWKGVPHYELVDAFLEEFGMSEMVYAYVGLHGTSLTALFRQGTEVVGVVSSNAQERALRFYGGVWTLDGGPVVTDSFSRRHEWRYTKDFDVRRAVEQASDWWRYDSACNPELGAVPITPAVASALLMEAGMTKASVGRYYGNIAPIDPRSGFLYRVLNQYLSDKGETKLDLAAAFGCIVIETNPGTALDRMLRFWELLTKGD